MYVESLEAIVYWPQMSWRNDLSDSERHRNGKMHVTFHKHYDRKQ